LLFRNDLRHFIYAISNKAQTRLHHNLLIILFLPRKKDKESNWLSLCQRLTLGDANGLSN
jgi:hypothetical protein